VSMYVRLKGDSEEQSGDRALVSSAILHVCRRRLGAHCVEPQDRQIQPRQGNHHPRSVGVQGQHRLRLTDSYHTAMIGIEICSAGASLSGPHRT